MNGGLPITQRSKNKTPIPYGEGQHSPRSESLSAASRKPRLFSIDRIVLLPVRVQRHFQFKAELRDLAGDE